MKKTNKLRRWAIEKLGGHVYTTTSPSMFGIVERTSHYDMVPLQVQVTIENRMMPIAEYEHAKKYLIEQAKRGLVQAAEPFFEVTEDFKEGLIKVRLNVYRNQGSR